MNMTTICTRPVYKRKGSKLECNNPKNTSMLNIHGKVYDRIIMQRATHETQKMNEEGKNGFRCGGDV